MIFVIRARIILEEAGGRGAATEEVLVSHGLKHGGTRPSEGGHRAHAGAVPGKRTLTEAPVVLPPPVP